MTDTGVFIILAFFFVSALAYSLLPGLAIGIPIGLFVQTNNSRFLLCFGTGLVVGSAFYFWFTKGPFLPGTWFGICAALMLTTLFGQWLGRKLKDFGDRV